MNVVIMVFLVGGIAGAIDALLGGDGPRFHLETVHHSEDEIQLMLAMGQKLSRATVTVQDKDNVSDAQVAEAAMLYTNRWADLTALEAKKYTGERRAELEKMAEGLYWIAENPARTYWEAMQAIILYQGMLHADGQAHGVTLGRIDQYCGRFLQKELDEGTITKERAQELTDAFILKLGDFFVQTYGSTKKAKDSKTPTGSPTGAGLKKDNDIARWHYECGGHHFSVGGQDRQGNDATNPMTIMLLQTYARLYITIPSCSVRIHKGTPQEVWENAIESSKAAGGMPAFENDDIIIPALEERGMAHEDALDYSYVFFRGRSILFSEQGEKLLLRFALELEEFGKAEQMPKLEGKRMIMMIAPVKKK